MHTPQTYRITSIDVLRAITMLLMIFVNDLWSLSDFPLWLEHTPADKDGMGLADTVFPAFLFLVGMSIPLSTLQRRKKGDSNRTIIEHILERSVALLLMGVFLVNGETINATATGITGGIWNISCCFCFILLWNSWPPKMNIWLKRNIKGLAVIGLFLLAWMYRGGDQGTDRFAPQWWGILGLIGWAYLVSAVIYVLSGKSFIVPVIAWVVFITICALNHAGMLPQNSLLRTVLSPIAEGAMPAFTMGGAITTLILLHYREKNAPWKMKTVIVAIAVIIIAIGLLTREYWGISKIHATPSWVLICSGITMIVFCFIYWLVDMKHKGQWFKIIQPAGTSTLTCYLLPYFVYGLIGFSPVLLPAFLLTGGVGLVKSFLFALLIVIVTGWLGKVGIRLKL